MERTNACNPADELNRKMVIAIMRGAKALEAAMTPFFGSQGGVTFAQFGVLEFLYHKGPARINTIIEKTLSTGGNMTVVIRNLEKRGLVVRHKDPMDGRAALVGLTPKGRTLIKDLFPAHLEELARFMSVVSEEEKVSAIRSLRKLPGK